MNDHVQSAPDTSGFSRARAWSVADLWARRHELTAAEWQEAAPVLLGMLAANEGLQGARPTCGSCDHWDRAEPNAWQAEKGLAYGVCRLNPPGLDSQGCTAWPQTESVNWCGQHSQLALVITGEALPILPHDLDAAEIAEWNRHPGTAQAINACSHPPEHRRRDMDDSAQVRCDWCGELVPRVTAHWHHVQDVAQRLGATRSTAYPGKWNVPSHARLEITAQELLDLGRAVADQGRGK